MLSRPGDVPYDPSPLPQFSHIKFSSHPSFCHNPCRVMKIIGLSRGGCWAMLILSLLVLILTDVFMYRSFAPTSETTPFMVLIAMCFVRLLRPDSKKPR